MAAPNSPPGESQLAEAFARCGYVVMPGAVKDPLLSVCYRHALSRARSGELKPDQQVPEAPAAYGDPIMEMLLQRMLPVVEQATGVKVFPTYSYFRVYRLGDELARHTDREACEVSMSISLGPHPITPWPLWIEGPCGVRACELAPGDAVLYRGIDCAHWREPFVGEFAAQVFLHYVDQEGPNQAWKHDKRTSSEPHQQRSNEAGYTASDQPSERNHT
jgi:hypothetical protein